MSIVDEVVVIDTIVQRIPEPDAIIIVCYTASRYSSVVSFPKLDTDGSVT